MGPNLHLPNGWTATSVHHSTLQRIDWCANARVQYAPVVL